jgi:alpha-L-arabinofuranosidase
VRWPGGCFADEYHWRKGIGPTDKRPRTLNPNWGGVIEPNTFGTHELMDFLTQIGAEAYVSINVGSGTPEEAADWLEYMTPTYHVFHMYLPFHDATSVPVSFAAGSYVKGDVSLPRLDAIAARDQDGKLWVAVTNVDPTRTATVEVGVLGAKATYARGETLSAPKVDSINTFEKPNTVAPRPIAVRRSGGKASVTLPPASVTVLSLD